MKDSAPLLFLNTFRGCDLTFAAYCKIKVGFVTMCQNSKVIQLAAEVLATGSPSCDFIEAAGIMSTL